MQFDTHYNIQVLCSGLRSSKVLKRTNWTDKSFICALYPIILLKISFVSGILTKVI